MGSNRLTVWICFKLVPWIKSLIVPALVIGPVLAALPLLSWPLWITFLVGVILLSFLFFTSLFGRDFFGVYALQSFVALIILYFVAFLSGTFVTNHKTSQGIMSPPSGMGLHAETAGTLFVLFIAMITAVGFTITVLRLLESHVRITSYDRFLFRLARLLRKTLATHRAAVDFPDRAEAWFTPERFQGNDEGLKILCHVPTLGNMSHQDLYISEVHWLLLKIGKCPNIPIETICVDGSVDALYEAGVQWDDIQTAKADEKGCIYTGEDFAGQVNERNQKRDVVVASTPIGSFYHSFAQRGFSSEEIRRGVVQAVEVIHLLSADTHINQLRGYGWPVVDRGFVEPHFSLFWTRAKAIIAFPLDRGVPRDEMKKITMIGYETTDPDVIEKLLDVYEEYKKQLGNPSGNGTPAPVTNPTP